MFSPNKLT